MSCKKKNTVERDACRNTKKEEREGRRRGENKRKVNENKVEKKERGMKKEKTTSKKIQIDKYKEG